MQCPNCGKEFEEVHVVPTNSMEPFTCVDPMKGIKAYGVYSAPKTILCHQGEYVHFAFLEEAKEQPPDTPEGKVWMVPGEERLVKMEKFDQDALYNARVYYQHRPQQCQEEGCEEDGIPCYYEMSNRTPDAWYCDKHAYNAGFCRSCGMFSAGFESFDFSELELCEACEEEYRSEFDEDDDYDEEPYYYDYDDEDEEVEF